MNYEKYLTMCPIREFWKNKRNEARTVRDQLQQLMRGMSRMNKDQRQHLYDAMCHLDEFIDSVKVKNTVLRRKYDENGTA